MYKYDFGRSLPRAAISAICVAALYVGTLVVLLYGGLLGGALLDVGVEPSFRRLFVAFDANWYAGIATNGYSYNPSRASNVAFFPGLPIIGVLLNRATGISIEYSLTLISNIAFLLAMWIIGSCDMAKRRNDSAGTAMSRATYWTLIFLAVYAPGIFFRMAYSESLFLLCVTGAVLANQRERPWLAAAIAGLGSAVRPVGIGLSPACCIAVAHGGHGVFPKILRAIGGLLLSMWGLLVYMAYLGWAFGSPFAFAHTQRHWSHRDVLILPEKAVALLMMEPIWSVYTPGCTCYWARLLPFSPAINISFQNPIVYVFVLGVVVIGRKYRIIDQHCFLVALGLLVVPYLTRGFEWCMNSHARFTSVVVPFYFVVGSILAGLPLVLRVSVIVCLLVWLGLYGACVVAGCPLY